MKNPLQLQLFSLFAHYFSWNTRFIKISKIELKKKSYIGNIEDVKKSWSAEANGYLLKILNA